MTRIGLLGLLIGALFVGTIIVGNDGDPTVLLAIGEDSPSLEFTESQLGGPVSTRPSVGHDGRFFFAQALDPLYLGDTSNARYLDLELYRAQRMFFPLLIGLGGLAPAPAIPWLMAVVQVLAYGLGTAATARLAIQRGGNPLWGLAFALNVALLMSVLIGGASVVALALAMAATAALGDGRTRSAAVLLALCVLSREVMILYVAGLVLYEWWRTRRPPLLLGAVPVLSFATWYAYLLARLDYDAMVQGNGGLAFPFSGFISAASTWADDPTSIIVAGITVGIGVVLVRQVRRDPDPLLAGTVGFAVLAVLLSDLVWTNWFDISRALAPMYTTFVIIVFARPRPSVADGQVEADVRPSLEVPAAVRESRL